MAYTDDIGITLTGYGYLEVTAQEYERAITRYLPGTTAGMRKKIDDHPNNSDAPGHFDQLDTFTEYLMVLAYLDSHTDTKEITP